MNASRIALRTLVSLVAATSLTCLAGAAFAQLSISRFAVAGGGGGGAGGPYALGGTAGQAAAGRLSGGSFELAGGFWAGGGGVSSAIEDAVPDGGVDPGAPPIAFHVYAASPNPVETSMVLAFDLPEPRLVRAEVYDAAGRVVRVLANEVASVGRNQRTWDRRDEAGLLVPAGMYFIRFNAGTQHTRQKVLVVR